MQEIDLGPNGALVFAMEYIVENMGDLEEILNEQAADDDYVLFDCPGQIEVYTHLNIMRSLCDEMKNWDFRVAAMYCMDVSFLWESTKFLAGTLSALSAMINLELPHLNVITKCDLVEDESKLEELLERDPDDVVREFGSSATLPKRFKDLNKAMAMLIHDYSMVGYITLNPEDEDSLNYFMLTSDMAIHYGEDQEPKANFDMNADSIDVDDL
eukprot:Trichotokara_eunicae@DN3558_c0_g2_i3.p1